MSNAEITVRMDERRLNKLEAYLALRNSSASQKLHETLTKLYTEYVPELIRRDVEELIRQERQAKEAQQRAERRIAVLCLHDAESDCHISIEENTDLFDICCAYHDRIRKKTSDGTLGDFAECLGLYQFIDPILYDAFKEMLPNAERIQTVAEFDFERQVLRTYSADENVWNTYLLKDVSSAVYRATQKGVLPSAQKEVFYTSHRPQHFLYFFPLPHGHKLFLPVFDE